MTSVIVLAGGLGRRFQRKGDPWKDKLLTEVDGVPIIARVLRASAEISDDIILSVDSYERGKLYAEISGVESVNISPDRQGFLCDGPLLGIASSAELARHDIVVVVAGDMPYITSSLLATLADKLEDEDVVTPYWGDGSIESLIFSAKRDSLAYYSQFLCKVGYWRSTGIQRLAIKAKYVPAHKICPDPRAFLDVNFRDDLGLESFERLRAEKDILVSFRANLEDQPNEALKKGHFFLAALKLLSGDIEEKLSAVKAFEGESKLYSGIGLNMLASQALEDAAKILDSMGLNFLAREYVKKALKLRKAY